MKKHFLLCLLILGFSSNQKIKAQYDITKRCSKTTYSLTSQEMVNNFAITEPTCTWIAGTLAINGNDITDLTPLSNIESVININIASNKILENLYGLEKLTINSSSDTSISLVQIKNNPLLTSLEPLKSLTGFTGNLFIEENNSLKNLKGLENIKVLLNGNLIIKNNKNLETLEGLDNLESIGEDRSSTDNIFHGGRLWFEGNTKIKNLNSLSKLKTLNGHLMITSNDALEDISKLKIQNFATTAVDDGGIVISANKSLRNTDGLEIRPNFRKQLAIINNEILESVNIITDNTPTKIWHLIVTNNPKLKSFTAARNIVESEVYHASSGFTIENNPELENLDDLQNLVKLTKDIIIRNNAKLKNINGLSNLSNIFNNTTELYIENNPMLKNLDGLEKIKLIGSIRIINNANLENINGLRNLERLFLTTGTEVITIAENPKLTTIEPLKNILYTSIQDLRLVNNPELNTCNIPNICEFLNKTNWHRFIYNNKAGCNSEVEVKNACATLGITELEEKKLSLYPNPTNDFINLNQKVDKLQIVNQNGQILIDKDKIEKLSIKELPAGVYYMRTTIDNNIEINKIVKY